MRSARLFAAALASLLVLAAAAAAIVPPMLDWGRYRGAIAALASSAVGHPVRIEGAVSLDLLPEPVLTAAGIGVADEGGHFALTAKALRLRVALGPLLGGRIDARDLTLSGASLWLGWPLGFRPDVARLPGWLTGLAARVEDGSVRIGGFALSGIDASLARDPLTATLSASGVATLSGRQWHFTAHLSPPGGDGSASLELALDGQGRLQGTGGRFSGQMAADGSLAGRVDARGNDLAQLLPAPLMAWRAEGRLSVASGLAVADELSLDLGGAPASGAVAFRVSPTPRLDLALAATRLDLDRWLPVLLRGGEVVPTGIDLSAEAATLGGGTLQHLRAAFDVAPDGVGVREATATLPGDASFRLDGRLVHPAGAAAAFDGALSLAAPDLPVTLRWLAGLERIPVGALPAGMARRADLSGRLALRGAEATLAGITGTLDGGAFQGSLGVKPGARPVITASLSVDRLPLDPWLRDVDAAGRRPAGWGPDGAVADFDLDLRLEARQALWHGAVIAPFALDASFAPGSVMLRRAAGSVDGLRAQASFALANGRLDRARLDLATDDLAAAGPLIPPSWHVPAGLLRGAARLSATGAGQAKALNLSIGLDLDDAHLDAAPTLDLTSASWSGPLTLRHPGAPRLLRLLGLPDAASWIGDGSLALRTDLTGTASSLTAENIDLTAAMMHLGGRLAVQPGPILAGRIRAERLPVKLPLAHGSEPLPVLDWLAGLAGWKGAVEIEAGQVLLAEQPLLQQAKGTFTLDRGKARIEGLEAAIGTGTGTGTLSGSLTLDAASEPPRVQMEGRLSGLMLSGPLFGLPLDLDAGMLGISVRLDAAGHSPAALLATLAGTAEATLTDGMVSGFDLPGLRQALTAQDRASIEPAARAVLAGGQSPVRRLTLAGRIAGGELTLTDATMQADAGDARAAGTVDLSGRLFDLDLALHPGAGAPEVGVLVAGPFAAPRRVPELAGLTAWLAPR